MRTKIVAAFAALGLVIVLSTALAAAGSRRSAHAQVTTNFLTIEAVFAGGTPTGALEITRTCTTGGAVAFPVAAPGTVNTFDMNVLNHCVVTATQTDGASTVTYSCTAGGGGNTTCAAVPAQNEAISGESGTGGTATITVTFAFPPPVAGPEFTG